MKNILTFAAVAFALYTFLPARDPPEPQPVVVEKPVAVALRSASSDDRQMVAGIYDALADITERDAAGNLISTTEMWRKCHSTSLRLAAGGTSLPGKYPGLDTAVEQTLARHLTLDNVAITPEIRSKIVAGCREVAADAR